MKNMKKLFALMLAVLMLLSVACFASAENTATKTFTITVNSNDPDYTHSYDVFQIFTGTYDETSNTLSNMGWGANGTGTTDDELNAALDAINDLPTNASDTEKLEVITKYCNMGTPYQNIQSGESVEVPAGYYLIRDAGSLNGEYAAYTTFVVQVVDNVVISAKSVKPSVDKQVLDEIDDAETGSTTGWGESADHAINEEFQFKLIATLPGSVDYDAYETYKLVFHDTMSTHLTFDRIDSVTIGGVDASEGSYSTTAGKDVRDWTLTIDDVFTASSTERLDLKNGTMVEVIYTAHLNENAVVSDGETATLSDANVNKVFLQYSNNPNWDGNGDEELGQTTEDSVWVFTYDVKYAKVDENGVALSGAGFTLYQGENAVKLSKREEPVEDTDVYYVDPKGTVTEITTNAAGKFVIEGLDAGTYTLRETTTPAGYNTCEDLTVTIEAKHAETDAENSAEVTLTETNGNNKIENKKGATLPETGGIGTTIFYVAGGVLVLLAIVLLVTKRRVGEN